MKHAHAHAVIGANWGDEGKGLKTDSLASRLHNPIVIRFNGGAQAGHTVTLPNGKRHVFSHFGSGTLQGVPTFLSEYFICNPHVFFEELEELKQIGIPSPVVYCDIESMLTTPYDVLINRALERSRGINRHGSCGLGINETVERCLNNIDFKTSIWDVVWIEQVFRHVLENIRDEWVPKRLQQLGITLGDLEHVLYNDKIIDNFIEQSKKFCEYAKLIVPEQLTGNNLTGTDDCPEFDNFIFEGAQGLLLHEDSKFFPHVTRSRTGMENVVALSKEMGIDSVTPFYMSRCYMTKHGAGPMPNELPIKPFPNIVDETNIPNEFQETLRFSLLDLDLLEETIKTDLDKVKDSTVKISNPTLVITCLDQVEEDIIPYIKDGQEQKRGVLTFLDHCKDITGNLEVSCRADGQGIMTHEEILALGRGIGQAV